jgi:hypothetical protein
MASIQFSPSPRGRGPGGGGAARGGTTVKATLQPPPPPNLLPQGEAES